jgi:hypothetical protein
VKVSKIWRWIKDFYLANLVCIRYVSQEKKRGTNWINGTKSDSLSQSFWSFGTEIVVSFRVAVIKINICHLPIFSRSTTLYPLCCFGACQTLNARAVMLVWAPRTKILRGTYQPIPDSYKALFTGPVSISCLY